VFKSLDNNLIQLVQSLASLIACCGRWETKFHFGQNNSSIMQLAYVRNFNFNLQH
jgi:hypothetical protein